VLRKACHDVLEELVKQIEPLLGIAMELERIALEDKYFIERKLYPNVDFYSGIIYRALAFLLRCSPLCLQLARTVGWLHSGKR